MYQVLHVFNMEWSDLRIFLELANHRSLRLAANELNVTQPTISRRIHRLESDLGLTLFKRNKSGHELTRTGEALLAHAGNMRDIVGQIEQLANHLHRDSSYSLRIGVVPGETAAEILIRGLRTRTEQPAIELADMTKSQTGDHREPDFLLRHHLAESGNHVTRRVGFVDCAFFGADKFIDGRSLPIETEALRSLPYIAYLEEQSGYITMRWLADWSKGRPPSNRLMNTNLIAHAVALGMGIAVLPCFIGTTLLGVKQLTNPITALRSDYWISYNRDLLGTECGKRVTDWVINCFDQANSF